MARKSNTKAYLLGVIAIVSIVGILLILDIGDTALLTGNEFVDVAEDGEFIQSQLFPLSYTHTYIECSVHSNILHKTVGRDNFVGSIGDSSRFSPTQASVFGLLGDDKIETIRIQNLASCKFPSWIDGMTISGTDKIQLLSTAPNKSGNTSLPSGDAIKTYSNISLPTNGASIVTSFYDVNPDVFEKSLVVDENGITTLHASVIHTVNFKIDRATQVDDLTETPNQATFSSMKLKVSPDFVAPTGGSIKITLPMDLFSINSAFCNFIGCTESTVLINQENDLDTSSFSGHYVVVKGKMKGYLQGESPPQIQVVKPNGAVFRLQTMTVESIESGGDAIFRSNVLMEKDSDEGIWEFRMIHESRPQSTRTVSVLNTDVACPTGQIRIDGKCTLTDPSGGSVSTGIIDVIEAGDVETRVTYTFTNNDKTIVWDSQIGQGSEGVLAPASFLAGTTNQQVPKELSSILFETFYTVGTATEAQAVKLVSSDLVFRPVVTVDGLNIPFDVIKNTKDDSGLNAHSLGSGKYGLKLGEALFTDNSIETKLKEHVSGNKEISLSVTSEGKITLANNGNHDITISGETNTLTNMVVSLGGETTTTPTTTTTTGKQTVESCHAKEPRPYELNDLGVCELPTLGLPNAICTDGHTSHARDFTCTPKYQADVCGGSTNCPPFTTVVPSAETCKAEGLVFNAVKDICELETPDSPSCEDTNSCDGGCDLVRQGLGLCEPDTGDNDIDGDGVKDVDDKCPTIPAPTSDGCPIGAVEGDLDKDGIPDINDQCPSEPENYNGFEDTDGCPDAKGNNQNGTWCEQNPNSPLCTPNPIGDDNPLNDPTVQLMIAVGIVVLGIVVVIAKRRS